MVHGTPMLGEKRVGSSEHRGGHTAMIAGPFDTHSRCPLMAQRVRLWPPLLAIGDTVSILPSRLSPPPHSWILQGKWQPPSDSPLSKTGVRVRWWLYGQWMMRDDVGCGEHGN